LWVPHIGGNTHPTSQNCGNKKRDDKIYIYIYIGKRGGCGRDWGKEKKKGKKKKKESGVSVDNFL
jgi:hypothetical protein